MAALAKTHFEHVERGLGGNVLRGNRPQQVEGVAGGTQGAGGRVGGEGRNQLGNEGVDGRIETKMVHVGRQLIKTQKLFGRRTDDSPLLEVRRER